MSKVKLNPQIELDVDEILDGIAQLHDSEFEPFAQKVMAQRARRRASGRSQDEVELLERINHGVPVATWQRYHLLNDKIHEETITEDERQEFMEIVNQVELADAKRLHNLIELAQLRDTSVDELMDELGISRRNYA